MNKLWSIISFEFWNTEWIGALGKNRKLPTKLKALFETLEDYFNAQAITLQNIASSRVPKFFDTFDTGGLPDAVQECLRRYIYYGVDFLLYNGTVAEEQAVVYQTTTSSRTDSSTGMNALSSLDFLSTKAVDSWNMSGIETNYKLWVAQHGTNYPLLDITKFYTKEQIDVIVSKLSLETSLVDERVTKEVEEIDRHIQSNFNHLNKYKADYFNVPHISDNTTGDSKLVRNIKFTGNLEQTIFIDTQTVVEDGTKLYDVEVRTSTDVAHLDAIVVDNINSEISENPALQAASFRLHKELYESYNTQIESIRSSLNDVIKKMLYSQALPGEIRAFAPSLDATLIQNGWHRVIMNSYETLINGNSDHPTKTSYTGQVLSHNHKTTTTSGIFPYTTDSAGWVWMDYDTGSRDFNSLRLSNGSSTDVRNLNLSTSNTSSTGGSINAAAGIYARFYIYDPNEEFSSYWKDDTATFSLNLDETKKLNTDLQIANAQQKETLIKKIKSLEDAKQAIKELSEELKSTKSTFSNSSNLSEDYVQKINEHEKLITNLNKYKQYMLSTPYGEENFESWLKENGD